MNFVISSTGLLLSKREKNEWSQMVGKLVKVNINALKYRVISLTGNPFDCCQHYGNCVKHGHKCFKIGRIFRPVHTTVVLNVYIECYQHSVGFQLN